MVAMPIVFCSKQFLKYISLQTLSLEHNKFIILT